jgi:hypothetical protein
MERAEGVRGALDAIAGVLWRSAVIGFAVLALWLLIYLGARGWMYEVHHGLLGIDEVGFVRANYGGMTFLKLVVFLLFLAPYVSIRWYLAGSRYRQDPVSHQSS